MNALSKVFIFTICCSFLLTSSSLAQFNYVSEDENSLNPGDWHDPSTWTITNGPSSEPLPSANWNNQVMHGQVGNISIYGYTRLNTNFNVGNGSPTIDVYDTLFVTGNLSLQQTRLTVHPNGLLIIKGNLTLENGNFDFNNNGNIVVTGNVSVTNGNIDNQNNFYSYGSTTISNGGSIGTCFPGQPCDPETYTETESDLQNDDPDLYNFVSSGNVVLPIKLIFFKGAVADNSIQLNWATSEEENFDFFSVERSTDGVEFESVGKVFSSGKNTKVRQDYQFFDKHPSPGTTYYRLKAVDFDGSYEYFKAIYVNADFAASIDLASIYPNPGNGNQLNLVFSETVDHPVNIKLYDYSGSVLLERVIQSNSSTFDFDNTLSKGMYILSMESVHQSQTLKWMVK